MISVGTRGDTGEITTIFLDGEHAALYYKDDDAIVFKVNGSTFKIEIRFREFGVADSAYLHIERER